MSDNSFLDIETSDAIEPCAADPGEYQIRIIGFRKDNDDNIIRVDKSGGKYFMPMFELTDEPAAKTFSKFMRVPSSNMEEKALNSAKWDLEIFKRAFGVPEGGFDLNDLVGREAWALIGKESSAEYGETNYISKFIAGA